MVALKRMFNVVLIQIMLIRTEYLQNNAKLNSFQIVILNKQNILRFTLCKLLEAMSNCKYQNMIFISLLIF